MKKRILLLLLLSFVYLPSASAQDVVSDLLARINNLRASLGLYAYSYNYALAAAAQNQAQWMADTGSIAHVHPDGNSPRDRAVAAGYGTTAVSENIYGGTLARTDDAWNFWINSAIHYAGLTSTYYSEIGIGTASSSWGSTFVLVFGNPGGPAPAMPQSGGGNSSGSDNNTVAVQPSFIMGVDEHGNIMHQVQPGDTIGGIALIYGYTWDDIPYLLELNGMADARELEEGSIFLVPPHAGTYTPTASDVTPTETPTVDAAAQQAQLTADAERVLTAVAYATYTVTPLPRLPGAPVPATETPEQTEEVSAAVTDAPLTETPHSATPSPTLMEVTSVAAAPTMSITATTTTNASVNPLTPWIIAAIALQVGVLLLAGGEYVLRGRRKKR
ncbi:MAG: CAP domain-containing protein [Anaerolineae bacterium]